MALSSQADIGSVEVLKHPAKPPPAVPQPRPSSVQYHYQAFAHSQGQGSHHFTRQLLHPDPMEGVHVGVGVEGRLPLLPWRTHLTPTYPLRLVVGQRQPHILLSFQGTSLQGLPQGPSEGARSASENSWNPPPGWGLPGDRASCQCAGKSAQLSTSLLQRVSGCEDPAGCPLPPRDPCSEVS